jgi:hypothetical protein
LTVQRGEGIQHNGRTAVHRVTALQRGAAGYIVGNTAQRQDCCTAEGGG